MFPLCYFASAKSFPNSFGFWIILIWNPCSFVFFPFGKKHSGFLLPWMLCMTQSLEWETGSFLVLLFSITPHTQCLPARVISGPIALVWAHSLLILKFPTSSKNRFPTGSLKNNILRITDGNEARGERGSKWALRYKLTLQTHLPSSIEKGRRICMSPETCLCECIKIVSIWWILREWQTVFRLFFCVKSEHPKFPTQSNFRN